MYVDQDIVLLMEDHIDGVFFRSVEKKRIREIEVKMESNAKDSYDGT